MGNGASPAPPGDGTPSASGVLATPFWCCAIDRDTETIVHPMSIEYTEQAPHGLPVDSCSPPRKLGFMACDSPAGSSRSGPPKLACVPLADAKKSINDDEATTADTARNTPPSPSKSPPTDFGGSWLCVGVSGDMEAFLQEMGLAEGPRKAASVARYGALRQVQNITQSGGSFIVENILDKPVTMRFVVGEGVQSTADQEGKPIFIEPIWDGEVLCVVSKKENGELIANSRRYIEGEEMTLELQSPGGTVVKRRFQRRLIFSPT